MSSVPISTAYISKLSKTAKSNPKSTFPHVFCDQRFDQNTVAGGTRIPAEHLRNGALFWSDCKVSVACEVESVRVNVERKA